MRKAIYLSCTLFLCASAIVGCSNNNHSKEDPNTPDVPSLEMNTLVGTWNGVGYAVAQEEEYNADYLQFSVEENGDYTLRNATNDEDILEGSLSVKAEDTLSITNTVGAIEYPILGWEDLQDKADLQCTILNKDTLTLCYNNISYIFEKEDSSLANFSLLDQTVSDVWYSDDGSKKEDTTYELSFNDSYFQLYAIKKDSDQSLLTSFIYQKEKDGTYTFYTYLDNDKTYPEVLSSIPTNEYTSIDLKLSVKDNTLTLNIDGKEMDFYSNLIYGLEAGSDAYILCDTSFQWAFDSENHFCYFTMNPDTDTLYLYMANAESTEFATATVCGEVKLDQEKKTLLYHFNKDVSNQTSSNSEAIYEKCEEMDNKAIPYTIEDKTLHIELDGHDYNFTLEDY